jgi:hypothetical protein
MVKKIKRTKLAPKLMLLAILLITVFTGFACTFAIAKEDNKRSTRLEFYAEEGWTLWVFLPQGEPWGEGKFVHQRYYKEASLDGTIDEIAFEGYDELDLHVRMDPVTGDFISIGKVTMFIEWEGLVGTFYGPVIAKGNMYIGPMDGKFTLQGTGDFEGMKLFGEVWVIGGIINGLSGTILIPNPI